MLQAFERFLTYIHTPVQIERLTISKRILFLHNWSRRDVELPLPSKKAQVSPYRQLSIK